MLMFGSNLGNASSHDNRDMPIILAGGGFKHGKHLAFSREQVLQPKVVDLSDVVADVTRLLQRVIGEDIELVTDLEEGLPSVRVDPGQLEHVILNLAVNARDAMPGGGSLTLRTSEEQQCLEQGGVAGRDPVPSVVLEVADTGTGMDQETKEHLFEPFYTTKELGKGTGLGLAMAYGVVTQSGGTIRVESEPGEGAVFRLAFPAVDAEPDRRDERAERAQPFEVADARVLVVEDDEAVRRVIVRILSRVGVEVVPVATAEEGLEAMRNPDGFDLLLTDLVLPGMSGLELVDRAAEQGFRPPVIMMSGYAEGSTDEGGELPPGITFLEKPFTPGHLVGMVGEVLGSR